MTALVSEFLGNADAGDHLANDRLVEQLGSRSRGRCVADGELPRRTGGRVGVPAVTEFRNDQATLSRVLQALRDTPGSAESDPAT